MSTLPAQNAPADLKLNSRVVALETGMYIFRYASQLPEGQEICITLQQAPLGKGSVDFFPGEGVSRNTLVRLGDCVIIRIKGGTGAVLVTEYHLASTAGHTVDLRIDRIDTSEAIMKSSPAPHQPVLVDNTVAAPVVGSIAPSAQTMRAAPAAARPTLHAAKLAQSHDMSLALEGHIERRGDVAVNDTWLGNPDSNARLEGFSISWPNKPQGVDLAYSCKVSGAGKQPAALSGNYIGTRRRAASIQSITFGLVGPQQKNFQLTGTVVFSGSPPQAIVNGQEMSGPTGLEHLVAIAVNITPKLEANAPRYQSPWEDPAITQIYKAHG